MKKNCMGLALVLASALFVGNVHAAWDTKTFGKVADATSADAYIKAPTVTIDPADQSTGVKNTTITYSAGEFAIVAEDLSNAAGKREANNSWVGVKVTLPTDVGQNEYTVYVDGEKNTEGLRNSTDYTEWFRINETFLNNTLGGKIIRTLEFDWDNKDGIDQTVKIVIDTMNISLYTAKENGTAIWTPEIAAQKLKEKEAEEAAAAKKAEEAKVAEVVAVEEDGVTVTGTILKENEESYKTMLEKVTGKGFKTVFGAYELKTEDNIGEKGLTLTFKVGTENNGRAAYILHQKKDGNIEEFNAVVTDGVVKINVSELSPFMVALGDVVKVKDTAPGTGDVFPIAIVGIVALGLAGTYTFKKLHD